MWNRHSSETSSGEEWNYYLGENDFNYDQQNLKITKEIYLLQRHLLFNSFNRIRRQFTHFRITYNLLTLSMNGAQKWIPTCRGGNILRQEVLSGQPLRTDWQNSDIILETSTQLNCLFVLYSLLTVTIHCTSNVRLFCTVYHSCLHD